MMLQMNKVRPFESIYILTGYLSIIAEYASTCLTVINIKNLWLKLVRIHLYRLNIFLILALHRDYIHETHNCTLLHFDPTNTTILIESPSVQEQQLVIHSRNLFLIFFTIFPRRVPNKCFQVVFASRTDECTKSQQ